MFAGALVTYLEIIKYLSVGRYELSGKFQLYSIKLRKSFIDNILITVLQIEFSVIPISPGTCKNTSWKVFINSRGKTYERHLFLVKKELHRRWFIVNYTKNFKTANPQYIWEQLLLLLPDIYARDYPLFSLHEIFFEKLQFPIPWYAQVLPCSRS